MVRFLPLLWVTLIACQSTTRRSEYPRVIPDKSSGPMFDDEDAEADTSEKSPKAPSADTSTTAPTIGIEPRPDVDSSETDIIDSPEVVITDELPGGNPNLPFGLPKMTRGEIGWIIARDHYVISWNPKTRNPNWIAWKLSANDLGAIGRQDSFTADPILSAYIAKSKSQIKAVASKDYTGSCFDRGHQVASSERQSSVEANAATFHMTNILPQTAFLNQRIWKNLEDQTKAWITGGEHDNLWIVSGPVYEKTLYFMGPDNNIAIPSANFKLVYSWAEYSQNKPFLLKSVMVPNMNSQGKLAYEDKDRLCAESKSGGQVKGEPILKSINYDDYQATVNAVEAAAHIQLPAAIGQ